MRGVWCCVAFLALQDSFLPDLDRRGLVRAQKGLAGGEGGLETCPPPLLTLSGSLSHDPQGCGEDETGLGLEGDVGLDFNPDALMLADEC